MHQMFSILACFTKPNSVFLNSSKGAKVDDPYCYGHTQFHLVSERLRTDDVNKRKSGDYVGVALRANAIASLFAWTGAQAMYQGKA